MAQQATQTISRPANRFANLWLMSLMAVLGLTLICTATLVAWPLIGYISSRLFG